MKKTVLIGLIALTAGLTSCSTVKEHRGTRDAPHDSGDNSRAHIINMPDGYPNVAFKCNGSVGIYANTRSAGAINVVPNDPNCPRN